MGLLPDGLQGFRPAVREWFEGAFEAPTPAQREGWPSILRGDSTLLLAPTGSGKTLAAFLGCLDRLMFEPLPEKTSRCRVLYVSPLKALAVDVERNLRAPIAGIAATAARRGDPFHVPVVSIRSGDTPPAERARFPRAPGDVLITTPESLYLLLTSNARDALRFVETIIVDEIHALVPTKRGAHLALSLERLQRLCARPPQRIGLSATQRPLDEVARFLGGPRAVTLVDAGSRKKIELTIEVPVEDMAKLGKPVELPSGPASQGPVRASIWTAIHPRLLELIRAHHSTLLFVNSRRVAERLAAALNELAGEVIAHAHHGSLARSQRTEVEEKLKAGSIRALVATSSLELGIDMGAIDLVVQIEAPPSVASGMQRIGRSGHQVGAPSKGILFPKYRADLLACAALAEAMHEGQVEAIRYPRNPLDVLAQQIVAMTAERSWSADEMLALVRRAAPFAEFSQSMFESVLDLLAGRYVSDELADLKPRIVWNRVEGVVASREGGKRIAIVNGGTIPDRGLYGVFLAGGGKVGARVGELDEEMVFECRVGETFLLGASTWRIQEITHDRVLVTPAPGEPGKMPFWHGDQATRPLELGRRIGAMVRGLRELSPGAARAVLVRKHDLDARAADNLLQFLADQQAAAGAVPDDRTIVVERVRDELGDWRVCVLSMLGGEVLAPWAMAVTARAKEELGIDVETMWTNDGFVVRFPEGEEPPDAAILFPDPDEAERLVTKQLGGTALFAAKFREVASRALLLPRRRPGGRTPLWQQRKRAADLLHAAARFPSFPMLLETFRECLRDVFDMAGLVEVLRDVERRTIRVAIVDGERPSPFASAILFGFVANYIYEGDAPLAERRAQALAIDQTQLRELLGEVELRDLLDPDALSGLEARLQRLEEPARVRSPDAVHDLLLRVGDLSADELAARVAPGESTALIAGLVREHRALELRVARETRWIAVEDAARFRDALGTPLPPGVPEALLAPVPDPVGDLASRYARTHGPFTTEDLAARFGLGRAVAESALKSLAASGRVLDGAFRPGGRSREWCDAEVLRQLRRRSLARLKHEVEPVDPAVLGRFVTSWHGLVKPRAGLDALLDALERLQGAALPASIFEKEILAARVRGYLPSDLDALAAAGEVVWVGVEPLGSHDGRIALYLTDRLPKLHRLPATAADPLPENEAKVVELLRGAGASFFAAIHDGTGGGFPGRTTEALWNLVWKGLVTNDTFRPLRAFVRAAPRRDGREARRPRRERSLSSSSGSTAGGAGFRSRRGAAPQGAEGRWSLIAPRLERGASSPTEWSAALTMQLLDRHGLITRGTAVAEAVAGGFSAIYPVLRAMEDAGRIRRGFFVSGVGATQFALPPVVDLLRTLREAPDEPEVLRLSAVDPANPYGAALPWPAMPDGRRPARAAGATVILVDGALAAWIAKGGRQIHTWLPESEPDRGRAERAIAGAGVTLPSAGAPLAIAAAPDA